jgi:hypothetical protein
LFTAIKNGHNVVVKQIIDEEIKNKELEKSKINVNSRDEDGKTFAHYAAKTGNNNIFFAVIDDLGCPFHIPDNSGNLPINDAWQPHHKSALEDRGKARELQIAYFEKLNQLIKEERTSDGYKRGIVFTHNFSLFYSSKKSSNRVCEVPGFTVNHSNINDWDIQAISEAFLAKKARDLEAFAQHHEALTQSLGYPPHLDTTNYLLVNIDLIVSDRVWIKRGSHRRLFISCPIYSKDNTYFQLKYHQQVHSEPILYTFLSNEANLALVFRDLFTKYNIQNPARYKVYSIILDIHSSQEMCDACEGQAFLLSQIWEKNPALIAHRFN